MVIMSKSPPAQPSSTPNDPDYHQRRAPTEAMDDQPIIDQPGQASQPTPTTTNKPSSLLDCHCHCPSHPNSIQASNLNPTHPSSRPVTPTRLDPHPSFNSPRSSHHHLHHLLFNSRPPSPIPRDDIIEGMSASLSSIFERDVEHFDTSHLTAQHAIQLAVPPVLDEAIEVLATVPTEDIIVDQIPLQFHLFNPSSSPINTESSLNSSLPPFNHPSLFSSPITPPRSNSSSQSPHHLSNHPSHPSLRPQSITLSSSPSHHPPILPSSISSFPFPSSAQPSNPPRSPSPPILHTRSPHHPVSCTSDSASLSNPSSPRSLSPTPSFMINRSMVTQLQDPESITTVVHHPIHPIHPSAFSTSPKIKPRIVSSTSSPSAPQALGKTHNPSIRHRKTCISFMSYVDVLNSERADPSDPVAPLSSAMEALRMARRSTASLAKRASSILSQSSRRLAHQIPPTDPSIGKPWVVRSRCGSNTSTYHSLRSQHVTGDNRNPCRQAFSGFDNEEAEVLSDHDYH